MITVVKKNDRKLQSEIFSCYMINRNFVGRCILMAIAFSPLAGIAQQTVTQPVGVGQQTTTVLKTKKGRKHELYFSWGYNKEWYTHSNVSVNQPSLGNAFTFVNVVGVDHPGWDEQFFTKAISIPQYNYRLGLYF